MQWAKQEPVTFGFVFKSTTQVVGDNAKTDPKRMGRGMDPYMIRYRSTRPRGGSVDCFGVGRRGSTPAWNIYGGRVDPWENGNISDLIWIHVSLVEGAWNFFDVMENEALLEGQATW
uniref:Uncharacterized protein n=1 Tax=Caenorhabditis japonica TaxID=281687 RepID=A0A8R1ISA4_CAEJA